MGKTKRYRLDDDIDKKVKNHYRRNKTKFYVKDIHQIEDIDELDDEFFESFSKIKKRGE